MRHSMANTGAAPADGSKPTPPPRPRHQLTRSISELSSPIRLHRHHSNRPTKEKDKDKDADARTPMAQSSLMPNQRVSLDRVRSEGMSPSHTPDTSRRASIMAPANEDNPAALGGSPSATAIAKMGTPPPPIPPAMKEELLRRARQNAEAREQGLKKTLGDVTTISNATTRRLDRAYYSVLEKIGTLQSTIVALRELAGLSHDLSRSFSHESAELITDISSQLEAFGGFEAHQNRLEMLQGQVREGRVRVRSLSERLDSVRLRIEGWEKADRHWQERTRKRLKVIWLVTSVLVFLVLLLFVTAQYMSEELGTLENKAAGFANESLGVLQNMTTGAAGARPWGQEEEEEEMELAWHLHGGASDLPGPFQNATGDAKSRPTEAVDEMLRIFDEL